MGNRSERVIGGGRQRNAWLRGAFSPELRAIGLGGADVNAKTDRVRWDFDDAGSAYDNELPGFNAAHVYGGSAGTRTVTVTITSPAGTLTDTVQISLSAAASNSSTISSGSSDPQLDIQNAIDSGKKQIYFQRGATYTLDSRIELYGDTNILFTATGTGANPVIKGGFDGTDKSLFIQNGSTRNIVFKDLKFDSNYTTAYSDRPNLLRSLDTDTDGVPNAGTNITVLDCTFDHLNSVYEESSESGGGFLFQGNSTVDTDSIVRYFVLA